MKRSKKRNLRGVEIQGITIQMRKDIYAKLNEIAGNESLAATVEKMTEHYHSRALRKLEQSQQVG